MVRPGQKVYFELGGSLYGREVYQPLLLSRKSQMSFISHMGTVLQVYTNDARRWFLVEYGEEKLKTCFHFSDIDRYVRVIKEKEKKNGHRKRKRSSL